MRTCSREHHACPWSARIHRLQGPPLNDLWIRHHCSRRPRKTGVIRGCRSSHLPNIMVKMLFLHTRERRQKKPCAMLTLSSGSDRDAAKRPCTLIQKPTSSSGTGTPTATPSSSLPTAPAATPGARCPRSGPPAAVSVPECRSGARSRACRRRPARGWVKMPSASSSGQGPDALPVGVVHRRAKRCIPRSGEGRAQSTRSIILGPRPS